MLLVVDANIVFSSLIAGKLTDLFLSEKLELVAPELLFIEIKKHKEELKNKSHFSDEDFEILLSLLEKRIIVVPLIEFISFLPKAEDLLGQHKKDAPYVALALKLNCPMWSYEKLFKKFGKVDSLTTSEVAKLVKSD
jgi:predicted nucleic acid-binding protein|tara:strand:- start:407 stop:817 length:411 start_codon:yes stop_codon:yes gene_type:complete